MFVTGISFFSTVSKQDLFAYNGSVFQAIVSSDFFSDELAFSENHSRIVSTLYGLLRLLDVIKVYRMAFCIKFNGSDMYHFWRERGLLPH